MTKTFWTAVILLAVLPVVALVFGGEPFPSAPASATFTPTVRVAERIDDVQAVQMTDEVGPGPAPVIVIHAETSSSWTHSPAGSCVDKGPECEGEARTALPGPEWTEYISLDQLHRSFEDACQVPQPEKSKLIMRFERKRDEIRSRRDRDCGPSSKLQADERTAFCERWRC